MLIKIIWVLIGLNSITLFIYVLFFLNSIQGRNVDTMEKGWMAILFVLGLLVILLAAMPFKFSQSTVSIFFSGFFAALPLVILLCVIISKKLPSFKKQQTSAEFYYKDKTQRSIAIAIEQADTIKLKELIKGQDLNVRGNMEADGLTYLQFAIRLGSSTDAISKEANTAITQLLLEHGAKATPALSEAVMRLPIETVSLLLDHRADPNTYGYANNDPLLFETISTEKEKIDIAILLIRKGANVNALAENNNDLTPVMFAANNARTSHYWNETWRLVRYLLEEAHADYSFTNKYGNNLQLIIRKIREDAVREKTTMATDFYKVVEWLRAHNINTEPKTILPTI